MSPARRRGAVAMSTAVALFISGCSLTFMTAPPSKACEEGVSMPITDTLLSLLLFGVAVGVGKIGIGAAVPAALAGVGVVGLTATSAGLGYWWSSRCSAQRDADFEKLVRERIRPALGASQKTRGRSD